MERNLRRANYRS